jgi:hypothetical protein
MLPGNARPGIRDAQGDPAVLRSGRRHDAAAGVGIAAFLPEVTFFLAMYRAAATADHMHSTF